MKYWLIILAGFLLFFRLGETTLNNWDEAWLASVAQDMVARDDFLRPQWNGDPWFYEPPLLTLTLAAVIKIFGTGEFWLRIFSASAGLAIVVITFDFAKKLFSSRFAGLFSALVLLSNIEFLFRSRQINTDIPLTLFLLTAVYATVRFERKQIRWLVVSFSALALAFLTKRASALLAVPALVYILLRSNLKLLKSRRLYLALGVFVLILAPWFVFSLVEWRSEFIQKFILGYTIGKIRAINPATGIDSVFYLKSLRHAFKIWSLLLPFAFVWFLIKFKDIKSKGVLIYLTTFLLALSLVPIKSSWFLIPAYPLLAVLAGGLINHFIKMYPKFSLVTLAGVVLIFGFQVIYWRDSFIVPETTRHQASLALKAKSLTKPGDTVYLDDDYLPVAVFYSQRRVIPLRFNRQVIGLKEALKIPQNSYILTNRETIDELMLRQKTRLRLGAETADLFLFRVE